MTEVSGQGGQITFDGQYVTISRKGFLARATLGKGEKRLPISQISAIQWKPAGPLVNGFIQFTVPGGTELRGRLGSQTSNAAKDENSVIFTKKQMPEFQKLRAELDAAIAAQHGAQQTGPTPSASLADELAKLASLRDQGILSPAEFEQQKARLLGP
ncbi:DUF4429 domain-containing protein [Streptomyces anulatus]|uniref:DUF4429 domain-containing protein n=1 Tax=Streptomyces anulatus TaxID=1892 RepID=UPI0036F75CC8